MPCFEQVEYGSCTCTRRMDAEIAEIRKRAETVIEVMSQDSGLAECEPFSGWVIDSARDVLALLGQRETCPCSSDNKPGDTCEACEAHPHEDINVWEDEGGSANLLPIRIDPSMPPNLIEIRQGEIPWKPYTDLHHPRCSGIHFVDGSCDLREY